jgi:hypothetical protein
MMQTATFKELGIRWYYWLIVFAFGTAGAVALIATDYEPNDRATLFVCGSFFLAVSLLAFLWPVLRVREKQGARFGAMRFGATQYVGILFPASRVKVYIALIGGFVFGVVGLCGALFAGSMEYRAKGAIAFVFYVGFVVMWGKNIFAQYHGVFLSKEGIIWHETTLAPCSVPWPNILAAQIYSHKERYSVTPTFGVKVHGLDKLNISSAAKRKLHENFMRHGWHLYFHAETLLVSLVTVERMIDFYQRHTAHREELASGAALNRLQILEHEPNVI